KLGAAFVGLVVAAAGFVRAARLFRRDEVQGLDDRVARRGLIQWVRVRSPEQEALAQEILRPHGAEAVRVHAIELERSPDDLPLARLRPDPRLGSEPLGRP